MGGELLNQMWLFQDKGQRSCCLIPEATALFQEWAMLPQNRGREGRFFYAARCYRYERPQEGRYREFTQLGIEILNPKEGIAGALAESMALCKRALEALGIGSVCQWDGQARRGLGYYLEGEGFEARCELLGAQRQVAGGGAYAQGAGFAIGLERALLALERKQAQESRPLR